MTNNIDPLIIFGAGEQAKITIDIVKSINPLRKIFLFDESANCPPVFDLIVHNGLPNPIKMPTNKFKFIVAVGKNTTRKIMTEKIQTLGYAPDMLIHPRACIGMRVSIEPGTVVCANAIINPATKISYGCIINSGSVVEHDCVINSFCHISPGAVLSGSVHVGRNCWIGANSTIKEGCKLGKNITIGAGSFVNKDLVSNNIYVGIPAKLINERK